MLYFKPTADRVVIRRFTKPEEKIGSIIIPEASREKCNEGQVIAVGPGKYWRGQRCPLQVEPGDHVMFGKYTGSEVTVDGKPYIIMREDDLMGVLLPLPEEIRKAG